MSNVDDEEMGPLFRAAASDSGAPPPGFDHGSVVQASRRITTRRRVAVSGLGLALVVVAGVGVAVGPPRTSPGGDASTVAAPMLAPAPVPAPAPAPEARRDSRAQLDGPPPAAEGAPGAAAAVPGAGAGAPPLGPGRTECADRQDPALRTLVEQVLPEVVGAPEAATTMECRPGGERGVNVEVTDGGATGVLTVQYVPPGTAARLVPGALSAPTASGGTVVVSTRGDGPGEPAPLADQLQGAVEFLAPRL